MPSDVRHWTQENRTARATPLNLRCLLHSTVMQPFVARSVDPQHGRIDQIFGKRHRLVSEPFAITQAVELFDGALRSIGTQDWNQVARHT